MRPCVALRLLQVQSKYSISQRELMLAQQAFSSDPEIKELVNNLKRLFFGDDADEMPDPDDIEVRHKWTGRRSEWTQLWRWNKGHAFLLRYQLYRQPPKCHKSKCSGIDDQC